MEQNRDIRQYLTSARLELVNSQEINDIIDGKILFLI
jgi:hypothetical protein